MHNFIFNNKFENNYDQQHVISPQHCITELFDTDSEIEIEEAKNLELKSELIFANWPEFKDWINNFAKIKGFNYKVRTSQMDENVIRRITYECSRSRIHNPQVSSDPIKRRNATSQRTQCP